MIPVLPGGELEILLGYCIDLAKRGVDTQLDHVQRFYRYIYSSSFLCIFLYISISLSIIHHWFESIALSFF
jgi:hypothetical protein